MLPDGLGSVRQETGPTGNVLATRSFDPFGVPLEGNGGTPFGYAGEQYDASTALLFLRARYYNPQVGRFLSRDPWPGVMTRPDTQNPYAYVLNNPVIYLDPSGHCPWCAFAVALGGAYIGARIAYEVGTLIVPGADQMRRDQIGGNTVLRASATIQRESAMRSIDPILVSAIIRHESAAFERRLLTPLPGMTPGLFANIGEGGQALLQEGDAASIGPGQMQLRRAEELEALGYVVCRANKVERIRALLNEQSAAEYAAGMVHFLSDQLRVLPGFNDLSAEDQRRVILISYNWGWSRELQNAIATYGFEWLIQQSIYDNETLDEYLRWSAGR